MEGWTFELFPKYTTLVAGSVDGATVSDPVDVLPFHLITVEVFVGAMTAGSVDFVLQESVDLETWRDVASQTVSVEGASLFLEAVNTQPYLRLQARGFSSGDGVTLWARGVARSG